MSDYYLATGLAQPVASGDGLDTPYWDGLRNNEIRLQKCSACNGWQWGPEWVCHRCHSFDLTFEPVAKTGRIFSYERVWHPVHPALNDQGPYIVVLVEFPDADNVRVVGNLLGDPEQQVVAGTEVEAVFEHHDDGDPPFTLLQWRIR